MSSYCLNVIYEFNYVVYFHKNALLTPHLHDFDNWRTFVAKFCRNNFCTFSANLLGLKNSYRQLFRFLDVCVLSTPITLNFLNINYYPGHHFVPWTFVSASSIVWENFEIYYCCLFINLLRSYKSFFVIFRKIFDCLFVFLFTSSLLSVCWWRNGYDCIFLSLVLFTYRFVFLFCLPLCVLLFTL